MNSIQQQAAFAQDIASLIRWVKECGHLVVIQQIENMSAMTKIFSYDSYEEVSAKTYEEMGAYWKGLDPLNRYVGIFTFERKETE